MQEHARKVKMFDLFCQKGYVMVTHNSLTMCRGIYCAFARKSYCQSFFISPFHCFLAYDVFYSLPGSHYPSLNYNHTILHNIYPSERERECARSNLCYFICVRHLIRSRVITNRIICLRKDRAQRVTI